MLHYVYVTILSVVLVSLSRVFQNFTNAFVHNFVERCGHWAKKNFLTFGVEPGFLTTTRFEVSPKGGFASSYDLDT